MTKKKRNHPDVDEILARPWCYYCERDFDDLKILINHQKAKHFKCERCGRRLNTAGGLSVHMSQVHKENLSAVDNALPNRAGLEIEIFGMEGIPEDVIHQHNQRVLTQFHQAEAERRAASGNSGPGGQNSSGPKKPKTEDLSDIKKRLAEHKAAKLAAENGASSGSATPTGAGQSQTQSQNPATYQTGSPAYPQYQQPYAPPPSTTTYAQPQTYSPAPTQSPYQAPGYGQPPVAYAQPPVQPPFPQPPYAQPPQASFQQSNPYTPQFSPPPFQNQGAFPGQPFPPQPQQNGAMHFPVSAGTPPQSRPYGTGSPVSAQFASQQQQQQQQQQRTQSPAQNGLPARIGSGGLPSASGLPQRPAVGAPPVNALQFQQMHQGQIPVSQPQIVSHQYNCLPHLQNGANALSPGQAPAPPNHAAIDDLISSASKEANGSSVALATDNTVQPAGAVPAATITTSKDEPTEEKPSKKDKEKEKEKAKQTRLVYFDNETSPEERMAMLPKYAYTPQKHVVTV